VSESIYLLDPDGNGVELYVDRSIEDWPIDSDGILQITTKHLDVMDLLSELDNDDNEE